tara:strand:+ start:794 stop:2905 length:2112 start_codon:yes stop_codon:yes gene_type:complete
MQKLVLYIDSERVDLFKDETVSLTQTIQNVKDIKKIFTEFTQTFSVPASKINNKIFKHYYNFNISNGYDARIKQNATLELNDLPFKSGKIALNGVDLKNNLAHTYKITFFGNTVDLKDIIGGNELSDLSDLNQYNQTYTFNAVKARLQQATADGNILVPLITHTESLFYNSSTSQSGEGNMYYGGANSFANNGVVWSQLKYAIKAQTIITAIEVLFPSIVFSNDFFNNSSIEEFDNLFLWLHRKKGNVTSGSEDGAIWSQVDSLVQSSCSGTNGCVENSTVNSGLITLAPLPGYIITGTDLNVFPVDSTIQYSVRIIRQGFGVVAQRNNVSGIQLDITNGVTLPSNSTYSVQFTSASSGFEVELTWGIGWFLTSDFFVNGSTTYRYSLTAPLFFTTSLNIEFNITEQIPKMKIIDFLTGLFQMFNLTAYVDESGTIVVRTLDSYYASSTSAAINIDQYLDTSKSVVDSALPFKSVSFSYKGLGTFLAKQFEQTFNTGWGSLSYTLDGLIYDAPSDDYKITLPFEHVMYERLYDQNGTPTPTTVQWGYFVDDNQEPYFGSPLLFYPIHQISGVGFTPDSTAIKSVSGTGSREQLQKYYIPSNTIGRDCTGSLKSLHFNVEINEYNLSTCFVDTLFNTKYKTYIEDVFNLQRRLTKVTAYLPYKIFSSLELNNKIQLGQNDYRINSIKTNLTNGKTEFELLNTIQ